jgi:hypothetical protein
MPRISNYLSGQIISKDEIKREASELKEFQVSPEPTIEHIEDQATKTNELLEGYEETAIAKRKDDQDYRYGETSEVEKDQTLEILEDTVEEHEDSAEEELSVGSQGLMVKATIERAWSELTFARKAIKDLESFRSNYLLLSVNPSTNNLEERILLLDEGIEYAQEMSVSVTKLGVYATSALVVMKLYRKKYPEKADALLFNLADQYTIWAEENLQLSRDDYNFLSLYQHVLSSIASNVDYARLAHDLERKKNQLESLKEKDTHLEVVDNEDPFEELEAIESAEDLEQESELGNISDRVA